MKVTQRAEKSSNGDNKGKKKEGNDDKKKENKNVQKPTETVSTSGTGISDFRFIKSLGEGNNSDIVGLFTLRESAKDTSKWKHLFGQLIAIKIIRKKAKASGEIIAREALASRVLPKNRYLMKYHGFAEDQDLHYILMEYGAGGNLHYNMKRLMYKDENSLNTLIEAFRCTASGLHSMHRSGLVHQDIASGNVLMRSKTGGECMISDFGTLYIPSSMKAPNHILTTYYFVSPEQANDKRGGFPSDVWALAMLFGSMSMGRYLFSKDDSPDAIFKQIKDGSAVDSLRKQCPLYKLDNGRELMDGMLRMEPHLRFTMDDVVNHPFLTGKSSETPTSAVSKPAGPHATSMAAIIAQTRNLNVGPPNRPGASLSTTSIQNKTTAGRPRNMHAQQNASTPRAQDRAVRITSGLNTSHKSSLTVRRGPDVHASSDISSAREKK